MLSNAITHGTFDVRTVTGGGVWIGESSRTGDGRAREGRQRGVAVGSAESAGEDGFAGQRLQVLGT